MRISARKLVWKRYRVLIEKRLGGAPPVQGGAFRFRGVQTAKGVHISFAISSKAR